MNNVNKDIMENCVLPYLIPSTDVFIMKLVCKRFAKFDYAKFSIHHKRPHGQIKKKIERPTGASENDRTIFIKVISEIINYRDGIKHGKYQKFSEWNPSQIQYECYYFNGVRVGKYIEYGEVLNKDYYRAWGIVRWARYNEIGKVVEYHMRVGDSRLYPMQPKFITQDLITY